MRNTDAKEPEATRRLLGGAASFGVVLYDLRNTHLYDAVQQRLWVLEALIRFQETRPYLDANVGGSPPASMISGLPLAARSATPALLKMGISASNLNRMSVSIR